FGLRYAKGDVIVALDADTQFPGDTIRALARRFANPQIGAVAGNAKVGNRINIVTRWQALEYITSQNMDRRAFASLNCITVVPGAVGAWRRELIEGCGGRGPTPRSKWTACSMSRCGARPSPPPSSPSSIP